MDLVDPLQELDGLGEDDGDDDAPRDASNLVPREVADGVYGGRVAGKEVATPEHGQEQQEGGVLEDLEGNPLDRRGVGRRTRQEQVPKDLG